MDSACLCCGFSGFIVQGWEEGTGQAFEPGFDSHYLDIVTEEPTRNDLWFLLIKMKILDTGVAFPRNSFILFFTLRKKKVALTHSFKHSIYLYCDNLEVSLFNCWAWL